MKSKEEKRKERREMAYLFWGLLMGATIGVFGNMWAELFVKSILEPETVVKNPIFPDLFALCSFLFFSWIVISAICFYYFMLKSIK